MTALDHLAPTHRAAVEMDDKLRAADARSARSAVGSVAELVGMLREHGDYWERVQEGRLRKVKRAMARLMQPFFRPQVRYNLLLAEQLGRVEVALDELRRKVDAPGDPPADSRADRY